MFISSAFAADETTPLALGSSAMSFLPLILIMIVFYVLLIRPQQKRMKEHKTMLESLRRGDRVVTGGGIIGTLTRIENDGELQVEIAEGVRVRVARDTITSVLSKPQPVKSEKDTPSTSTDK